MKRHAKAQQTEPVALMCNSAEAKVFREFLTRIGDKWSIILVVVISKSPGQRARFSELQKRVAGISQRMLTTTLRNLERDGFLTRTVYPEVPPRVEYRLTELGQSLLVPMCNLVDWIGVNWPTIKKAREGFDSTKERAKAGA